MRRDVSLTPRTIAVLAAGAVLVYAVAVWLVVVSPKRSEAASLGSEVAAAEIRLADAQAAANRPGAAGGPVSDVLRLAKAMPGSDDQPGLVLELSRLAEGNGVTLQSISSQTPVVAVGAPTTLPVVVTVGGSFKQVSRFLQRTRTLVTVRRGRLRATGRLFTVQSVELVESATEGFPMLDATVTLNAFVYDGPIAAAEVPTQPEGELQPTAGRAAVGTTS
jgi:type IV pilus assembly PilO-like protein